LAIQNGAAYAWGWGYYGQLGNGIAADSNIPMPVSGLSSGVTAVAAGSSHSLAIKNGQVYAWGDNLLGQLGDGTTNDQDTPELVSGLSNIVQIAASSGSSYALAADGTLYAWGYNYYGQLGTGDTTDLYVPIPTTILPPEGYKFTSIAACEDCNSAVATIVPTPEPTTLSLLALGGLAMLRRRR
jgi:alpha-tubulin suppressor-like RCC1 family protein